MSETITRHFSKNRRPLIWFRAFIFAFKTRFLPYTSQWFLLFIFFGQWMFDWNRLSVITTKSFVCFDTHTCARSWFVRKMCLVQDWNLLWCNTFARKHTHTHTDILTARGLVARASIAGEDFSCCFFILHTIGLTFAPHINRYRKKNQPTHV